MKKPKVLDTDWEIAKDNMGDIRIREKNRIESEVLGIETVICENVNNEDFAKVLKSAPDMIEALIGIVFDFEEENDLSPAIKEAKQVLEKAGVEL